MKVGGFFVLLVRDARHTTYPMSNQKTFANSGRSRRASHAALMQRQIPSAIDPPDNTLSLGNSLAIRTLAPVADSHHRHGYCHPRSNRREEGAVWNNAVYRK
jgi:hypothetical protein